MCPQKFFTLVNVDGMICAVGGEDCKEEIREQDLDGTKSAKRSPIRGLMSESRFKHWAEYFPPLPTQRNYVAVVYTQGVLIIAGGTTNQSTGEDTRNSQSVEILDVNSKQWYTTSSLPHRIQRPSMIATSNHIFINGAYDKQVYYTSFTHLLLTATRSACSDEPRNGEQIWKPIAPCPTSNVYLSQLDEKPIVVGGLISKGHCSKDIHMYNIDENRWLVVSEVSVPQRFSQVTVSPDNTIILAVGWTLDSFDDAIEIGNIDRL